MRQGGKPELLMSRCCNWELAANGERSDRVERQLQSPLSWGQPLRGAQSET